MAASSSYDLDLRTISWEYHPVLRAIEANRFSSLHYISSSKWHNELGNSSLNYARSLNGDPCLILALSKFIHTPSHCKQLYELLAFLLQTCNVDPNIPDRQGRTPLTYAILHNFDLGIIELLQKYQTLKSNIAITNSSPIFHAAASNRLDLVQLFLSKTQRQVSESLQRKLITLRDNVFTPRFDLLDVPWTLEGSPKHYTPFADSPLNGTLVNGIRFHLFPSSPCSSSGVVTPVTNNRNPSVSLANSEDSRPSLSKLNSKPIIHSNIRRITSGFFYSDVHDRENTVTFHMVPLVQLAFNLSVYLETCLHISDAVTSPGHYTDERREMQCKGSLFSGEREGVHDSDEKEEMMSPTEPPTRRKSSAPILIKSRSVEAAMNSRKPQRDSAGDVNQMSFHVMPRDVRKNALASTHLIERQGSAPQLMLKRRPNGGSNDTSANSSPVGSPVKGLSRCGTRQQIIQKSSPLGNCGLTQYMKK